MNSEPVSHHIAIVGMSGRFPGADNVEDFWRNLAGGVESISNFSDEQLLASGLDVAAIRKDTSAVAARGILKDPEWFDASFFGMNAKQAEVTDPQQRLFLEACWDALENAGCDPSRVDGPIGVFAGCGDSTYYLNHLYGRSDIVDVVGERVINLGNEKDYLATWVAYKLNLRGPAISVNTACSTSLVAVCQAAQSLLNYQCDVALAGGVWITFPQHRCVYFQEGGILSPDGHCRTFDARAQGTVSGAGLGVVVLKRLKEALLDGDHIYAVLKGFGLNNDGAAKAGFTAPSVEGQAEAVATAMDDAEFDPDSVSYIECHGTATPIGDPIEIAALTQAFRLGTERKTFCAIGSVKSNIGHLGAGAGVAGLIKTALCLENKMLPASLHYSEPNAKIDFANSPFFVNSSLRKWENVPLPRRAGVSSFGLGGTNAHVSLEEAPAPAPVSPSRSSQLLLLSAKTAPALDARTDRLLAHLKLNPQLSLPDAAFTLQQGRQPFQHRRMLVCRDVQDGISILESRDTKRLVTHHADTEAPSVAFMFPGQGAQHVQMGAELYRTEPIFQETVDHCCQLLMPSLGIDLRQVLYPVPEEAEEAKRLLTQTRITQPALFIVEYALAKLWMSWGVQPAAMIGHSIGEYVAACIAGVFTLEDALALVAKRGTLMQSMAPGLMMAVSLPEAELRKVLPLTLSLAAVNGPSQCVVSGPTQEIQSFSAFLSNSGTMATVLSTSHAFHSAMMDPILSSFSECISRVPRNQPSIPFVSNLTGKLISAKEACDPQYWALHLRNAVRFGDGVKELLRRGDFVLLEVGPGTTLSSLARLQLDAPKSRLVLSTLRHVREERSDISCILTSLGQLWLRGCTIDWAGFYAREGRHRIPLPGYPFQRERYWIDARRGETDNPGTAEVRHEQSSSDSLYLPTWKRSELSATSDGENILAQALQWLLFTDETGVGEKLAAELVSQGRSVIRVAIGPCFRKLAEDRYAINPTRPEDYQSLLLQLHARDKVPQKIVHLWSMSYPRRDSESWSHLEESQDLGLHSLLYLARALGESNTVTPLDVEVVTSSIHSVSGEESLLPERATLLGAVKVIPLEYPNVGCRNIDVVPPEPGSWPEERLVEQLICEFRTHPSGDCIAYRGQYRWIETFEAIHLDTSNGPSSRLKRKGVYLITGGLGGIGLTLATFLAHSVQAKLILISRTPIPEKTEWGNWLATHSDQDEVSTRIKHIQALEAAGAEVLIAAADVADYASMQDAIATAKDHFSHIDGVIHCAGSADFKGLIQRRSRQDTVDLLAAKVTGALVLDKVLSGDRLDFFVLCSSRITADPGGAAGQVAYVAANEFLDAFALHKKATDGRHILAIGWDAWREVGMAERSALELARTGQQSRVFTSANSLSPAQGIALFNRILNSSLARVVVSVMDLNTRRKNQLPDLVNTGKQHSNAHQSTKHARPDVGIYAAPESAPERTLAKIWQDLLGIQEVGIDDNFFDLGGDSLLLLRVQAIIKRELNVTLSSAEMFQYPTIGALAQRLNRPTTESASFAAAHDRAQLQRAVLANRQTTFSRSREIRGENGF